MRTKVVPIEGGGYELRHDSTNELLGKGTRAECEALAVSLRVIMKAEVAKTKIAELGAPSTVDPLSYLSFDPGDDEGAEFASADQLVELGCGPMSDDVRLFTDEVRKLSATPLLDSNANEVPRTYREGFVLRPGTFVGMNGRRVKITRSDILEFAANHDPLYPPKIQIVHSDHPNLTLGYVAQVKVSGTSEADTRMHQLLEFRGRTAVDNMEAGLYRDLSVGLWRTPGAQRLKETSIVGDGAVGATGGEKARILPLDATPAAAPAALSTPTTTLTPAPTTKVTKTKGESIMGFFNQLFGAMVGQKRAEKKAAGEAVALSNGLTEADLDAVEAGKEEALTREKALAIADSLGFDKEGVGKLLLSLEADGVLKKPAAVAAVAPATPTPTLTPPATSPAGLGYLNNDGTINLSAFPPELQGFGAVMAAQQAEIVSLKTAAATATAEGLQAVNDRACNDLIGLGKITPADKPKVLAVLGKMDDGTRADYLRTLGLSAAQVQFGRQSIPETNAPESHPMSAKETNDLALDMLGLGGWTVEGGKLVDPHKDELEKKGRGFVPMA